MLDLGLCVPRPEEPDSMKQTLALELGDLIEFSSIPGQVSPFPKLSFNISKMEVRKVSTSQCCWDD